MLGIPTNFVVTSTSLAYTVNFQNRVSLWASILDKLHETWLATETVR